MSLRLQLLLFGALTLALPWAGLVFIEQMEGALRQGLESSLLASAGTAATVVANDADVDWPGRPDSSNALYLHRLAAAPRIDGYRGDWTLARGQTAAATDAAVGIGQSTLVWLGVSERFAYVFVEVGGDTIVYPAGPGVAPFGDRIALLVGGTPPALLLSTSAPGAFRAQTTAPGPFVPGGAYEERVLAAWQETGSGYNVEARIPLTLIGDALGIAVIDVDRGDDGFIVDTRSTWQGEPATRPLVIENAALGARIATLRRSGERYRVVDASGWVLADSGLLTAPGAPVAEASYSERLLRAVLRRSDPLYGGLEQPIGRLGDATLQQALQDRAVTAWYRYGPANEAVVAAAVPVNVGGVTAGALVLEQVSDSVLALGSQARMQLLASTLLISIAAGLGLFAYATLLSFRIGRLARAAGAALEPSGEIRATLPGRNARDEIGDLSRSLEDLLGRLGAYTSYLRTLTGKLAHEIRTPIAIVSTSLENLERDGAGGNERVYLERMRQGTVRLDSILAAMSAATRVEQAVAEAPAEEYDLVPVVRGCTEAYRGVYPEQRFDLSLPAAPCVVFGSGDLLAQMLDKLVENAVSFSAPASVIRVAVTVAAAGYQLSVANTGPLLPAGLHHQVFDSLVTVRERREGATHLGLGLYIVALIAKFHGGRVRAENLADSSGVVFTVTLPPATI